MKNKSVTYALIGVVLTIWGLVFYRLFSGAEEETISPSHVNSIVKSGYNASSDTFELILDYRDPFLGKTHEQPINLIKHVSNKKPNYTKQPAAPVALVDWSFITYKGAITNKLSKKEVGIFTVNKQDVMLSPSQRNGEVMVLKISRDSAVVLFNGSKKTLFKTY